jgi:hypothetical protein
MGVSLVHRSPAPVATVEAVVVALVLVINEALFHSLLRQPQVEPAA